MTASLHAVPRPASGAPRVALGVERLLFVRSGLRLVDDVSFELRHGERVALLGPNGAGKSLLLRLCHGLLEPTSGRVAWHTERPAREAMVFQRPVMLRRSALANVTVALAGSRLSRAQARAAALAALDAVDLRALADRPARALSGGEQQRVALARAAVIGPDVLWLDEPTASLDPGATRRVEEAALRVNARGATVVMSTHDIAQSRRFATRVLFLHRGQLLEDAPADRFFEAPASALARRFLAGELLD